MSQSIFVSENEIPGLAKLLASRLTPSELKLFEGMCSSGRVDWTEGAVDGIVALAKLRIHNLSLRVKIADKATGKEVAEVALLEEDVSLLDLPEHLMIASSETFHPDDEVEIRTVEEVEEILQNL